MNSEYSILILFLVSIVGNGLVFLIYRYLLNRFLTINISTSAFNLFVISVGFSFLGLVIGILTGLSSSAVVGAIVPAFLTFIGVIATYIFISNTGSISTNKPIAVLCVVFLSFYLMVGAIAGIKERKQNEIVMKKLDFEKEVSLKQVDLEIKKELIRYEKTQVDSVVIDTISIDELR
jgi:hypothetical protein